MVKFTASYQNWKIDVEDSGTVLVYDNGVLCDNTKKAVCEIAQKVGFTGASYFSKTFKKEKGLAPLKYKQKAKTTDKSL